VLTPTREHRPIDRNAQLVPDPLPLFHGTLRDAARAIVAQGFRVGGVEDRLRAVAEQYDLDYERLAATAGGASWDYAWQRDRDASVHFSTNPRYAADFARRGSEIDYYARQAAWALLNPDLIETDPSWSTKAWQWAQAEVARTEEPVVIRLEVPHHELPAEEIESLRRIVLYHDDSWGKTYLGRNFQLPTDVASRYIVGYETVSPCTCWRDGHPCATCRDARERPGGWDGSYGVAS
jgi:hypothetical protein